MEIEETCRKNENISTYQVVQKWSILFPVFVFLTDDALIISLLHLLTVFFGHCWSDCERFSV